MKQLKKVSKETLEPIVLEALKKIGSVVGENIKDFQHGGEFATNFVSNLTLNLIINTSRAFEDQAAQLEALQSMFAHVQAELLKYVKVIADDVLSDLKEVDLNETKH